MFPSWSVARNASVWRPGASLVNVTGLGQKRNAAPSSEQLNLAPDSSARKAKVALVLAVAFGGRFGTAALGGVVSVGAGRRRCSRANAARSRCVGLILCGASGSPPLTMAACWPRATRTAFPRPCRPLTTTTPRATLTTACPWRTVTLKIGSFIEIVNCDFGPLTLTSWRERDSVPQARSPSGRPSDSRRIWPVGRGSACSTTPCSRIASARA